jgi:hypothetical protein
MAILLFTSFLVALGVAMVAIYSLANTHQARDIRHLIDLYAAEQGIYFGLENMDG